ncbi:hypothetical protein [Lewinella sp. W8]|uniref:hypothetical protein n=1 Tax=Lewinella sp. W8 TaxID=2528208 RepID=UPI001067917C|nr:hypothetical protein [Lewinella sp. W8]MTB50956.1 hypothetical protein [Lewinella sp. W8]
MNYEKIINYAWRAFDHSRKIVGIKNVSANVSTNRVYLVSFEDGYEIIAKLTVFGSYETFVEDHTIINVLANNLPVRYSNFLSRALMKGSNIFFHRYIDDTDDAWVIFYRPIHIDQPPPKRFDQEGVRLLGREMAEFHRACATVKNTLPQPSRDMTDDVSALMQVARKDFPDCHEILEEQCKKFLDNTHAINAYGFDKIPVFVDWNIGNFSVDGDGKLASRWDYDWFRMTTRVVDFYFLSRVVSDVGDRTDFTYEIDRLMEDRFILFLQSYHEVFPLQRSEIQFIREAYRFFLLNYVFRLGQYFFRPDIGAKLREDTLNYHFDSIDRRFDTEKLLNALQL